MIDYSQHSEQSVILDFFKVRNEGSFLDLGAFDMMEGSNTRALAELGWGGLAVEACPENFVKMRENCKEFPEVELLCAAVMPESGVWRFYHHGRQVGGCCQNDHFKETDPNYWVAAITPLQIGERWRSFRFVSIDLEGVDFDVLKEMSPLVGDTELLCIENHLPFVHFKDSTEYYAKMLAAAAEHGFTKIVGTTEGPEWGLANTLLSRP